MFLEKMFKIKKERQMKLTWYFLKYMTCKTKNTVCTFPNRAGSITCSNT